MLWRHIIHLGDLPLTMAAAAAMAVWMMTCRAWRMAFWWSLFFLFAIGIVAATKIAFLAWGSTPTAYDFRALSGHAAGVTAVSVTFLHLALRRRDASIHHAGIACGLLIGVLMAMLLVVYDEHSLAEAAGGWAIGALAGIGTIGLGGKPPTSDPPGALLCASVIFMASVFLLRPLPIGYLMWRVAKLVAHHASALVMAGF